VSGEPIVLSVIVPVYNGRPRVEACLRSLLAALPPAGGGEVIAVDNGSTDGADLLLERLPGIRCLREPRPGSYAARNRGAAAASGGILAFTDGDCEVEPDWGRAILEALADPGLAGATVWSAYCGREYAATLASLPGAAALDRADTRNLAIRAPLFRALGGFLEEWPCAADWELGARLHHQGHRLALAPGMRARHHDPENLEGILRTRRLQAACMAQMWDRFAYLRQGGYFAPVGRRRHRGRHVPGLRTLLYGLLAGVSLLAAARLRAHAGSPGEPGYRLYRLAGALSGVSGLYRPDRVLAGWSRG
jgi:glycosyltransferase involved in cell wall biosynthesis